MRRHLLVTLPTLIALAGACATASQAPSSGAPPDRVLVIDATGQVLRQSTMSEQSTASFAGAPAKVWPAVLATFSEIGIEANYADQANGRYGARNYRVPRTLNGVPIGQLFNCGSGLTGPLVDVGTVRADIVTSLGASATAAGTTDAVIYVSGHVRRNDGNSSDPVACSSTGQLEQMIRTGIEKKLASS